MVSTVAAIQVFDSGVNISRCEVTEDPYLFAANIVGFNNNSSGDMETCSRFHPDVYHVHVRARRILALLARVFWHSMHCSVFLDK